VRFEHSFTVPTDIDTAWSALTDIGRVAPCIPGATLESVAGDEVHGAIKVRLGSIGPTYKGTMTFVQRDPEAHRIVLKAHAETRTSGSATAGVVATVTEFGGTTTVLVISDVEFTGKAGQLEASVIADAGTRLVRQFAQRLTDMLTAQPVPAPQPAAPDAPGPEATPEPAAPAAESSEESSLSEESLSEESLSQSQEPTPTPERAADADIGDESPMSVMPDRVPTAESGSAETRSAAQTSNGHQGGPTANPPAPAKTFPPAAGIAMALLLLLLRRRRRKRKKAKRG
jgi:carbon monoxide dehydrogenase subunit G